MSKYCDGALFLNAISFSASSLSFAAAAAAIRSIAPFARIYASL